MSCYLGIGTCQWSPEDRLAKFDGLAGPDAVAVGQQVAPNEELDFNISLTAPQQPGEYAKNWQLQTLAGDLFGSIVSFGYIVLQPELLPNFLASL